MQLQLSNQIYSHTHTNSFELDLFFSASRLTPLTQTPERRLIGLKWAANDFGTLLGDFQRSHTLLAQQAGTMTLFKMLIKRN